MNNLVLTKSLECPEINRREILRYAGVGEENEQISALLDECISEGLPKMSYHVCYCEFDVSECECGVDLGFCVSEYLVLKKYLCDCDKIILFAATVGREIDRLIAGYSVISPSKAALLQAFGSERVEALCDAFCDEIKDAVSERGFITKPRVSAGYGDIPLEMQRDIFAHLDCTRKIGVTLSDSLFMRPEKSVTAIIGIKSK